MGRKLITLALCCVSLLGPSWDPLLFCKSENIKAISDYVGSYVSAAHKHGKSWPFHNPSLHDIPKALYESAWKVMGCDMELFAPPSQTLFLNFVSLYPLLLVLVPSMLTSMTP